MTKVDFWDTKSERCVSDLPTSRVFNDTETLETTIITQNQSSGSTLDAFLCPLSASARIAAELLAMVSACWWIRLKRCSWISSESEVSQPPPNMSYHARTDSIHADQHSQHPQYLVFELNHHFGFCIPEVKFCNLELTLGYKIVAGSLWKFNLTPGVGRSRRLEILRTFYRIGREISREAIP